MVFNLSCRELVRGDLPRAAPRGRDPPMVEAGGQHIRSFRRGPDYAFIRACRCSADAERVIRRCSPAGS